MVNMLHCKIRVNSGLGVSKVVTSTLDKKGDKENGNPSKEFEGVENDYQTQKQLAEQLGVSQRASIQSAMRDGKDSEDR